MYRKKMLPDYREKLRIYHALLVQWQKTINLVSPKTIPDAWRRHFEDSLQIDKLIHQNIKTLYDFGSGAGFPALVLAIIRPTLDVTLIESDARKCAFLQTVSRETSCQNISILNDRLEIILPTLSCPDYITARAFASLKEILSMAILLPDHCNHLHLVLPKGRHYKDEIDEAEANFIFNCEIVPSCVETDSVILNVCNIKQRIRNS